MPNPDNVNWFERHVEKIVLGVALALLVFAVFYWVLDTPRSVDVNPGKRGGDLAKKYVIPPDERSGDGDERPVLGLRTFDGFLADWADLVLEKHQQAEPPAWDPPDTVPMIVARREKAIPDYPALVAFTPPPPPAPEIPKETGNLEGPTIADTIAPGLPKIQAFAVDAGWELAFPDEARPLRDRRVAHGVAVLDVNDTLTKWAVLQTWAISRVIAVQSVEVLRQEQLPDGTWSEEKAIRPTTPPADPRNPLVTIPDLKDDNAPDVRIAMSMLAQPQVQSQLLQPEYAKVYVPEYGWVDWKHRLPNSDGLEELFRQPVQEVRPTGQGGFGGAMGPDPRMEEEYRRNEEARRRAMSAPRTEAAAGAGEQPQSLKIPGIPPLEQQWRSGKLALWFHDETLETGKRYRYRLRVQMVNPLYTHERSVRKGAEEDARTKLVAVESSWSAPVRVTNPAKFFVGGYAKVQGTMNVDVYTRVLGQWVKARFTVRPGMPIGGKARQYVVDPVSNAKVYEVNADFETGSVTADFDWSWRVYKGNNPTPSETAAMHYIDQDGILQTRTSDGDRSSEEQRQLESEARRTEGRTRAAGTTNR